MPLDIIGAGIGRTGTVSLKLALEMLGFGPCHHMMELLEDPSAAPEWVKAWRQQSPDWERIYRGYNAAVDFPTYQHYRTLAERYPEAKVILTVRDPERWYESAEATIFRAEPSLGPKLALAAKAIFSARHRNLIRIFANLGRAIWDTEFEGRFEDKDFAISVFEAHVAEVKRTIAPERLLVFRVQDGWAPLCAFLGVPVPDTPFPRGNSRAEFHERLAAGPGVMPAPRAEPLPGY